jgi:DNA-binding CsgD family transcriptional regulator
MGGRTPLVGRDAERQLLESSVRACAAGSPSATIVSGEAGAGKTRLVRELAEYGEAVGHTVLWGSCLRFAADTSPFLPIGRLLTQWHRRASPAERDRVLTGADQLATIAPVLGTPDTRADPGQLIPLVAAVLDRIVEASPTVLIVDDLQWADSSSLDLLAYLLVGFAPGQRLAVLATYRDTDLGEGHRLHGWLADMLRQPAVSGVRLERLGLAETEELVTGLLDRQSVGALGAEVFARSAGNPYLTELLVADVAGTQERGEGLHHALLASWHRLADPAREVLQLLAVGGRPVDVEVLERLAEARGRGADVVRPSIAEAANEGLVVREAGRVWFHHPLLAEVIAATVEPPELVGIHREYVVVLEAGTDLAPASRAAHLALHHHGARHADEAFTWSLRAADEAGRVRAVGEEAGHLHRACELWDQVSEDVRALAGGRPHLLERTSRSALSAGEHPLAFRLREQAIALVDPESDPVLAVRLRLPLHHLRAVAGRDPGLDVQENRTVLALAERCPGTAEHAIALAHLAHAEVWGGVSLAAEHAEQAVQEARSVGSDEALAAALGVRSQTRLGTVEGLDDAEQAVALAARVGDPILLGRAALWRSNLLEGVGRIAEVADSLLGVYREIVSTGSVHDAMFARPYSAALALVDTGRWSECRALLRELMSRRFPADWAVDTRVAAAYLALRSGDAASCRGHLDRAHELLPIRQIAGNVGLLTDVQAHWASGDPARSLELLESGMAANAAVDYAAADEMLIWAARAAADLAESPGRRSQAVAWLTRIDALRGDEERFAAGGPDDRLHPAQARIHAAERARCLGGDPELPALWEAAASTSAEAGLVWEEALARYRLAQAVLTSRGPRDVAAAALRRAARLASDLGARPILDDVTGLARHARIPLEEPAARESVVPEHRDSVWTSLTARECEVLSHLVAGRTYAEIAKALFISEKTVSVHVSNLLRKTGTSSRIEVAELARRSGP